MINFPDTPSTGDHFTAGGTTWVWDGNKWTTLSGAAAGGGFLPLLGGTMLGPMHLAADPGTPLEPATKQYADTKLALAGGPMTGPVSNLTLSADPATASGAATKRYADSKLSLAGGTMSGDILLRADPTQPLHPSTKEYTDTKLPISGGVLTGSLTLNSNPVNPLDASTKQYTDTQIRTRFDALTFFFPGKPASSAPINLAMTMPISVPANLVGTVTYAGVIPTGSANFIVNKLSGSGNVQLGGITVTTASHTSNVMAGVGGILNVGDVLQVAAPSGPDATLSDVCVTIKVAYL